MNPDFVGLLRAFVAADVRFLIVGAYALAYYGRPRATGDLDIWGLMQVRKRFPSYEVHSPTSALRLAMSPSMTWRRPASCFRLACLRGESTA